MTTETWQPVEPLSDDDLNRRYWREPQVGDRVRVRLSGECNAPYLGQLETGAGMVGHDERMNNCVGTVGTCAYTLAYPCPDYADHPIPVRYIDTGDGYVRHGHFAAAELEILP